MYFVDILAGGEAIGITVNFVNNNSKLERNLPQMRKAYQFERAWFENIRSRTNIWMENFVYSRCATNHYFVFTPKKNR